MSLTRLQNLAFSVSITLGGGILIAYGRLRRARGRRFHHGCILQTRYSIASGTGTLDASFVEPTTRESSSALLICHGIGEVVEDWFDAQALLAEAGCASLVFDYQGYGRSTGRVDLQRMEDDAVVAFASLRSRTPGVPHGLLGFSLGSGVAAAILSRARPDHLVLCAAFPSLRQAAACAGAPRWGARIFAGMWHTGGRLAENSVPVTIVHGERDRLFRPQLAQELAATCGGPCELIIVPSLAHNDPIFRPDPVYWAAIAERVCASSVPGASVED